MQTKSIEQRHTAYHNRMLIIYAKGSDWLRQLQSRLMNVHAVNGNLSEKAIFLIYFEAASKTMIL